MSLMDYGRLLARRGWIIVLTALIAAGSAYLLSRQETPTYRSTQLVLVQPARNDLGLAEATIRLINSYVVYLNSTEIARQVIANLNEDMLPGELKGNVTIVPDRDRLTVQIDVDLESCEVANRVASEWGLMLVRRREAENRILRQEDRINAFLPDSAQCGLQSPRPTISAAAGGVLGGVVGAAIVFILEYLESGVIRRREDIERALDLPVLAAIPEGERKS